MSNSRQPPMPSLTNNPRVRFQNLIDGDFKARYNAAMVGFDASTTGKSAIPFHPLPDLQKLNSRLYAKLIAREIFYDLRSTRIAEMPNVDPFSGDIQVELNFPGLLPPYEDMERVVVAVTKFRAWAHVYNTVQARMTWLDLENLFQKRLRVEWERIEADGFEMPCKGKGTSTVWYLKTS